MSTPTTQLKLADVPAYLERTKGFTVSLVTIHNWTSKGVKGVKLQTSFAPRRPKGRPDMKVTTPTWLADFLTAIGQ